VSHADEIWLVHIALTLAKEIKARCPLFQSQGAAKISKGLASAYPGAKAQALNLGPADCSTNAMLLDSRVLFLTILVDFRGYLEGFVQNLLTNLNR
jgi:hypothetical protein